MAESATKLAVKTEKKAGDPVSALQAWRPLESLFHEVDRLFQGFDRDFLHSPFRRSVLDIEPFWRRQLIWGAVPVVDIVEKDNAYEVTAELPRLDEKNVEVKLANGGLTLKGEKREEKEEKKKDYYLHERHFGSFERRFRVPEGVEADKVEANFNKGVLIYAKLRRGLVTA